MSLAARNAINWGVSFGTYARKVSDPTLPYGRRFNALRACVQSYQPLGFVATFAYLEHLAGPMRHDEKALLHALELLSDSRRRWLVVVNAYAARRLVAKRQGRRTPRKAEENPSEASRWYGNPRPAALFTIDFLLRERNWVTRADPDVVALALRVRAADGRLDTGDREQMAVLRRRNERLRDVSGWPDVDWPNWHRSLESLWLLHHVNCAA